MIAPRVVLAAIIFPAFYLLDRNRDGATLAVMTGVMTALASSSGGALMGAITESLRKTARSTVLAIVYATTIAVVGGTTQLLITWLISVTGDVMCPAYYYIGATVLSLVGMVLIRESAPAVISRSRPR